MHTTRRNNDQYYCPKCQRSWDINEDEPPCEPLNYVEITPTVKIDTPVMREHKDLNDCLSSLPKEPKRITPEQWLELKNSLQIPISKISKVTGI